MSATFVILQHFSLLQSYIKTSSSGEKYEWNLTVAGRNVHFSIVDLGGKCNFQIVIYEVGGK